VLLTSLFFGNDGLPVMPLVIVAVVVAHVTTIRLTPPANGGSDKRDQHGQATSAGQRGG